MKKAKNENICQTMATYLRKRKFGDSDSWRKSNNKIDQSLDEMSLHKFIEKGTAMKNALVFSSINADANIVDQQFNRLKGFVGDACEPMKSELTYLLFPIYIYLNMELVVSGQITAAQKFYQKFVYLFIAKTNFKSILDNINSFHTDQDLKNNSFLSMLRSCQYEITLSSKSLDYLSRFLKNYRQTMILQVINVHLKFKIINEETVQEINQEPIKVTDKQTDDNKILNVIQQLRNCSPSIPAFCAYNITNSSIGVTSIDMNAEQTMFAGGFEDSSIRLWNLTPKPFADVPSDSDTTNLQFTTNDQSKHTSNISPSVRVLRGHSSTVYNIKFIPELNTLLSCSQDTTIRAWDLDTFSNIALYNGHNYPIWCMDISPLGLYFATGSHDHTARLWTLDRTHPLRIFTGHNMDVDVVKFHPNCNYLATGSSDRTVKLWNIQDANMVRSFYGHRSAVMALDFSRDGKLLASAGEDRKIKIWDIASGNIVKEFRAHSDTVYSLQFSPDGSILASGGADECIRLWDMTKLSSSNNSCDNHGNTNDALYHHTIKSTVIHFLRYNKRNVLFASGTPI